MFCTFARWYKIARSIWFIFSAVQPRHTDKAIMSTVISGGYPMAAKLHKDFQSNNLFGRDIGDYGFSLHSTGLGASDKLPPLGNASLPGAWPVQRPSVARRNSTSSVSSISSARNRLNVNSLTSMANVIPETTTATITAATISSMPTMEERFRGRAYSEGASSLSMEGNLPPQQQQPGALSRYKTELCRPFEENGVCKYGDKCQFAHGKQELRHLIRHPKYKTELCRTFHTSGFCPYGPRCHFIHNQDDFANRANFVLQAAANLNQQHPSKPITQGAPMAVPTPHISERNHHGRRPARLSLLGNLPFQSTQSSLGGSPPYYQHDVGSSALMSPTSPNSVNNGTMFSFPNPDTALASFMMNAQYDSAFEMLLSPGPHYESTVNDDSAFDGPMTPPDSDPESMTGSPPEKQRLPIFRCLSQTS